MVEHVHGPECVDHYGDGFAAAAALDARNEHLTRFYPRAGTECAVFIPVKDGRLRVYVRARDPQRGACSQSIIEVHHISPRGEMTENYLWQGE